MREKEPVTRIIYVRHGATDFPSDRIYCDEREDPALNAAGLEQARAAAELLHAHNIDAIYASPSKRTRMTAEEIARVAGASIAEERGLMERRFGVWEGLYFSEIERDYPEEYQAWKRDKAHYTPRGGETILQLSQRVDVAINALIDNGKGKTMVVVAHVGSIRVSLAQALKIPVEWYRQLRIDYGAITRVDYGSSQNNLIYMNVSKYLF